MIRCVGISPRFLPPPGNRLSVQYGIVFDPIGVVTGAVDSRMPSWLVTMPAYTHGAPGSCCAIAVALAAVQRWGGSLPAYLFGS